MVLTEFNETVLHHIIYPPISHDRQFQTIRLPPSHHEPQSTLGLEVPGQAASWLLLVLVRNQQLNSFIISINHHIAVKLIVHTDLSSSISLLDVQSCLHQLQAISVCVFLIPQSNGSVRLFPFWCYVVIWLVII